MSFLNSGDSYKRSPVSILALIFAVASLGANAYLYNMVKQNQSTPGEIRASTIVLTHPSHGSEKLVLGFDDSLGISPAVTLFDQSGMERLSIGLIGESPNISFKGGIHDPRLELGIGGARARYPGIAILACESDGSERNLAAIPDQVRTRTDTPSTTRN